MAGTVALRDKENSFFFLNDREGLHFPRVYHLQEAWHAGLRSARIYTLGTKGDDRSGRVGVEKRGGRGEGCFWCSEF